MSNHEVYKALSQNKSSDLTADVMVASCDTALAILNPGPAGNVALNLRQGYSMYSMMLLGKH